jgi:hypothetical protein
MVDTTALSVTTRREISATRESGAGSGAAGSGGASSNVEGTAVAAGGGACRPRKLAVQLQQVERAQQHVGEVHRLDQIAEADGRHANKSPASQREGPSPGFRSRAGANAGSRLRHRRARR